MAAIADHNTPDALSLVNRFYAEGKDMGALLDELACLVRDFMIVQSAPREAISLLSGVASDVEVKQLAQRFTAAELVRMLSFVQQTAAGFARSASRRLDTELCIMRLCQPELQLDAQSLNSRISRLEEQISSGSFVVHKEAAPVAEDMQITDEPALPVIPEVNPAEIEDEAPTGFWLDICSQVRMELKPPALGFFAANGLVQGVL
jgi:DNA polymerase-3 subunit gamma/tau